MVYFVSIYQNIEKFMFGKTTPRLISIREVMENSHCLSNYNCLFFQSKYFPTSHKTKRFFHN